MTKKTYFKGKKKSVKPKKYQFAGFEEAMQIDNTGYLNKLYNPNYYGSQQAVDTTATKENISKNVQLGQTAAINIQGAKENTADAITRLQQVKTDAEAAEKQQLTEMNEASKTQAVTSAGASLLTGLGDIAKTYLPAAAAKASTTAVAKPPANLLTKFGTPPSSNVMNFKVPGAESIGEQGVKNTIGSATWSTPGAAAAAAGIGIAASVGGSLWDNLSEDADPYTYSRKEKWGDWGGNILSETGKWGGVGATVGGPLGALIGGVAGVGIGAFKAARESKQNKKMAKEMTAERDRQQAEYRRLMNEYQSNLDKQQRVYDYNKAKIQQNIVMGEEQLRQNRLQDLTESQLSGNTSIVKTGGKRNYFGKGGVSVPGGQIVPIGGGAVEFVGRKHSQGGILLDPQTEVEGGETMDQVAMNEYKGGGKMNDYFFSAYLKLGGKSFAQRHKELIKSGAGQAAIQELARKQEEVAYKNGEKDRSPKQIAKYGGVRQYAPGGPKDDTVSMAEWKAMDKNQRYKLVYDLAAKAGDPMPEVTAAQWAIESDFGRAMTGTWNFFGQTTKSKDSTNLATPRDPSGGSKRFKNYESLEDSVADHVNRWSPKYKDAKNPEEALMMLENYGGKGRYAEGYPTKEFPEGDWKAYVKNTNSIIKQYDPVVKAKPAAAAQAQAQVDGQPMSAAEYQRLTAGRPPLPSGAVQSTSSPIDYALLGTGLGIARGTGALAGFVGGAARDMVGNATRPTPGTVTPGAELVRMPQTGTGVTPFAPNGPNWTFWKPGVGGQATTQGGKFPLMAPVKESVGKLPDVATAQKAAEFTPTPFSVTPAADGTAVDPGTEGPFPQDPAENLSSATTLNYSSKFDPTISLKTPLESIKPDIKKSTEPDSKPEFNPMYTKQQIKNARRLAAFGFLSQLAAPTAALFMKPKLVGAPQTITPALLDAAMAAKAVGPMVTPGTVAAQRLGRIAPQTDNILNTNAATKQFMANMGDPSAMVGMIASDTRAAEAERKEMQRAQEINTQLASEEGKIKLQASMANQDASMQSQIANQRNINEAQNRYFDVLSRNQAAQNQAYITNAENKLRADLANADLRAAKQNRDIAALSVMGSNIAGGVGDIFSYASEEAKARINAGETGVYDRNFNSLFLGKTGGAKKKMYGGTNSYTSRLGDLKYKRALKVK